MQQKDHLYFQLGQLTRQLHDSMRELGVPVEIDHTMSNLPDAKNRLQFIAQKTEESATKVLNLVDSAKAEHDSIMQATHELARNLTQDPVRAVASGAVMNFVDDVEKRSAKIDSHLTDIMMAQDFQDLTGQVVKRVIQIVSSLEANLVHLLVQSSAQAKNPQEIQEEAINKAKETSQATSQTISQATPQPIAHSEQPAEKSSSNDLQGPAVVQTSETVGSQKEVDDLLASLGF